MSWYKTAGETQDGSYKRLQYDAVMIHIVWMIRLGQISRKIAHDSNVLSCA
jgi:hypothetical protein